MTNPFRRRENWRHWAVALLGGAVLVALLLLLVAKLGYSHRPDVERAMQPPPRDDAPAAPVTPITR
jgi:hypothetical protein